MFSSVFWAANPSYYALIVDSSGTATYRSSPDSLARTGVPFVIVFKMTAASTESIFDFLQQLDFLDQNIPHSTGSPENKPVRTLEVYYAGKMNQLTYSESGNSAVHELTTIFERISKTMELGRHLSAAGTPEEIRAALQKIETRLEQNSLSEAQALAPIVRAVAENKPLDAKLRARARSLVETFTAAHSANRFRDVHDQVWKLLSVARVATP